MACLNTVSAVAVLAFRVSVVGAENPITAVLSKAGNDGKRNGFFSLGKAMARANSGTDFKGCMFGNIVFSLIAILSDSM